MISKHWVAHFNVIGTLQVPLHRIDQQKHQFMIFMQKEVASQITDPDKRYLIPTTIANMMMHMDIDSTFKVTSVCVDAFILNNHGPAKTQT